MSLLDLSCTLDEKSSLDMDLLESNYYKLPFCDDDDMKSAFQPRWSDCGTSDDLCDPHQLPHSPSSTASSAAGGGAMTAIEHACSLMNERPDTPLMAIKFEDFSNGDYGLNDMGFPTFCDDLIPETYSAHGDEEIDVDDMTSTNPLEFVTRPPAAHRSELDCSLSSAAVSMGGRGGGATITISKGKDGSAHVNTCHRRASNNLHDQPVDFSFSKHQRVDATTTSATSSSSSSSAGLKRKAPPMLIYDPSPKNHKVVVRKQVDSDFDLGDLISLPSASTAAAAKKPTATSTPASCPPPGAKVVTNTFTHKAQIQIPTSTLQSILKNGKLVTTRLHDGQVVPNIRIKTEGGDSEQKYLKITQHSSLPPTPPGTSSSSSSDSDGSVSPHSRCGGNSPITRHIRVHPSLAASSSFTSQLLSSSQRLTQAHGPLVLTEEEKRTLIAEGYPVPSKLPLTKTEEKSLKKVRRKIKNKISAQESRRKKKEYVEKLEKRMDIYNKENMDLKRKLDSLENSNRSLLSQLRSLQTLVAGKIPKPSRTVTTQTSSCLMMLVLCFAVFLGGWFPTPSRSMSSSPAIFDSSSSSTWRSRILMTIEDQRQQKGNDVLGGGMLCRAKDGLQCATSAEGGGGGDTYERPKSRVNINDTGDQKIIRNTMEPRSAADVLAAAAHGRKVSDGVVVMTTSDTPTEMSRKIAAAVNRMLVKE